MPASERQERLEALPPGDRLVQPTRGDVQRNQAFERRADMRGRSVRQIAKTFIACNAQRLRVVEVPPTRENGAKRALRVGSKTPYDPVASRPPNARLWVARARERPV